MVMTRNKLLRSIDEVRIREAIREAEELSSGEICVSVSPLFWGNVEKAAQRAFVRMGMTQTRERNGVLFFVVPSRRTFVVLGDRGIHERVGQDFWHHVVSLVSERFHEGDFNGGLLKGIAAVGERLAEYFPHDVARDTNELSNHIDFGDSSIK
jgi:uncharacterized membrane protein